MTDTATLQQKLAEFTGSERFIKNALSPTVLMSEGTAFVRDACKANWLVDRIAIEQLAPERKSVPFQVWKLTVRERRGHLTMAADLDAPILVSETVGTTDFPLPEIAIWVQRHPNGVATIHLPSEH